MVDGIVDLLDGRPPPSPNTDRFRGEMREDGFGLAKRIKAAAGGRWPATLGDVIEFGCGPLTDAIVSEEIVRGMLVVDTDLATLQACRTRLPTLDPDYPLLLATLDGGQDAIRDAAVDTVMGSALLSGVADVRAFLTMVHRVLKPGGRALFVAPNRRYYQAVCQSLAAALSQRFTRDGAWPEGCGPILNFLAESRRLLVHRDDPGFLISLTEKHLFDSGALENLGQEIGFATAELLPLDPDPAGGETMTRLCLDAGAADGLARSIGVLAAATGHPYLSLLGYQDQSALGLLWLTKAAGPAVRIHAGRPAAPPVAYVGADEVLGGAEPRWSVELLARDTPDGIAVTVGGWCLSNADVRWVRITLDDVARHAPVWRHRPDVHEVLNRGRIYHALNALCSGIDGELLFTGVHPRDDRCPLRVDIVLAGGLIVTGPAPARLVMDEAVVVAH